jgi:hypothetical protein
MNKLHTGKKWKEANFPTYLFDEPRAIVLKTILFISV